MTYTYEIKADLNTINRTDQNGFVVCIPINEQNPDYQAYLNKDNPDYGKPAKL
jgi:hypothetical protein